MPTTIELQDFLYEVPDVRVLLACAQRCGCRFGIRGGLIRHLLFSFDRVVKPEFVSLYDFVVTFSDIDIVVERESDWRVLEQAIAASLPFAGFHRWEVETLEKITGIGNSYVRFPIDKIIVWIDGLTRGRAVIRVEGLLVDADSIISDPSVDPDVFVRVGLAQEPVMSLLTPLRFARYYFQFPDHRRELNPQTVEEKLEIPTPVEAPAELSALYLRRIELGVLQVMFNARKWREAYSFISSMTRFIPRVWLEASQVLSSVLQQRFASADLIGSAIYNPGPSLALRARMFARKEGANVSGGLGSVIPWTKLSSLGGTPCCCLTSKSTSALESTISTRLHSNSELPFSFAPQPLPMFWMPSRTVSDIAGLLMVGWSGSPTPEQWSTAVIC